MGVTLHWIWLTENRIRRRAIFQEWEFEEKEENDKEAAEKDILNPERRRYFCDTLKQAMVGKLKDAIADYAQHEYTGCKIDHPSQKYHDLCLWTSPTDWIVEYGYDEAALSCLDIYEIIQEWDSLLWSEKTRGLRDLSPREAVEAYKTGFFSETIKTHTEVILVPTKNGDFWKQKLLQ